MKNFYSYTALASVFVLGAIIQLFAYTNGTPGGRSGSVGDGGFTCGSGCHNNNSGTQDWISTNIPEEGYVPGQTYQITFKADGTSSSRYKFGFEGSAENSAGANVGQFVNNSAIQVLSGGNGDGNITHTGTSAVPNAYTQEWVVDWVAPTTGTGQVTFSSATVVADYMNSISGDFVYTSTLTVAENEGDFTSITEQYNGKIQGTIAGDHLLLSAEKNEMGTLLVYDVQGKQIANRTIELHRDTRLELPWQNQPTGVYIIAVQVNNQTKWQGKHYLR